MINKNLEDLCRLIRYDILTSTTAAGSGHPTSSLSAVELITTLFFGGYYHYDLKKQDSIANDRFILSKGHASPLLYSLYHAAGCLPYEKLLTLRKFGSCLQGHPTPFFPYADVATGSLGQGLSVAVGMALGVKLRIKNEELKIGRTPKIWVLLGDSEMAEGQIWEAMESASFHQLDNLVAIVDVNRLGQQGETIQGWDVHDYEKKARAFGWEPIVIEDGHNLVEISQSFSKLINTNSTSSTNSTNSTSSTKPKIIIARTIKGKGVSFLEDKNGWHGKTLDDKQLKTALEELGQVDLKARGKINSPKNFKVQSSKFKSTSLITNHQPPITNMATREAFGDALVDLGKENPNIVVLDAEVANSTYENKFQKAYPDRFFEMFIAEENMMSTALGLSKIGYIPFVSTFAAFLTRTYDQVRMAQYSIFKPEARSTKSETNSKNNIQNKKNSDFDIRISNLNLNIVGSHAGVSIGEDGPSQMGLEDLAMMRSILNGIVLYPSDAVSTRKLVSLMAKTPGIKYLRASRGKTPVIYDEKEEFVLGGFKLHPSSIINHSSSILVIAAGITLHEALKAQKKLEEKKIAATVVDLYCIKPLNNAVMEQLINSHRHIIVVEDHYPTGGIGEAISELIVNRKLKIENWSHLCVRKIPMSGTPEELLNYEEIDSEAIIKTICRL